MRARSLGEVAAEVGASVEGGDPGASVRGLSIDSRDVRPGHLFVALQGDRADGHAFVMDAFARGAVAAIVRNDRAHDAEGGALIRVTDPARVLLDLAREERSHLRAHVVGITGSTGKTCTKDLTAAVLRKRFRVVSSRASFNNEVGLPLTILEADGRTEVVVCEMGSRGPGHIRLLCEVARPDVGVVTNVGVAHMELFGSPQVLRDAKAELPEALPADGTAVLFADDEVVRGYANRTPARTVTFGLAESADVLARDVAVERRTGRATFDLVTPLGSARVALPMPGEHMVANALAAAAVGWTFGLSPDECAGGLAGAEVTGGRMEEVEGADGVRILNDAYNANPTSMAAALRAARWMAGGRRCIAVLGPMAELGTIADQEHLRIGQLVTRLGIDTVVVVGPDARLIAVGAEREGVERERIHVCDGVDEAVEVVRSIARPGDLVLVKASRVARLERVAEALRPAPEKLEGATT